MVIYIVLEDSKCSQGSVFFPKKSGFANEASFAPKLRISAINSKLRVTTFSTFFLHYFG